MYRHCLALATTALLAHAALAQASAAGTTASYPARTVRMLVGFAPGGGD